MSLRVLHRVARPVDAPAVVYDTSASFTVTTTAGVARRASFSSSISSAIFIDDGAGGAARAYLALSAGSYGVSYAVKPKIERLSGSEPAGSTLTARLMRADFDFGLFDIINPTTLHSVTWTTDGFGPTDTYLSTGPGGLGLYGLDTYPAWYSYTAAYTLSLYQVLYVEVANGFTGTTARTFGISGNTVDNWISIDEP